MISIIICSKTPDISPVLFQNIQDTIGYGYELIVIDNSKNTYSIFEAYNLGIEKSKGHFWCFMHDDIYIHTHDWGIELEKIFETDPQVGLIGVAGAKIKTKMPSAWWHCPKKQKIVNIIQHLPDNETVRWNQGFGESASEEVAVIDGVFMAGRKDRNIRFDSRLKGFHHYDLNLALEYQRKGYKIVAAKNILLEHFSFGTVNETWYSSALVFDSLYGGLLPLQVCNSLSQEELRRLEIKNGRFFCLNLVQFNLKSKSVRFWLRLCLLRPLSQFNIYFLKILLAR